MNRIKQLRTEKEIRQKELANLLGIEVAGVSKLELGRVPLKDEYIIKLANYFGVSADYLLGVEYENSMTNNILKYTTTDESMSPLLNVGDVAYIEKKSTYDSGDTILFTLEDKKYIRKIIDKEKEVELIAMNIYFPKMILSKNDFVAKKFSVVGKVIRAEIKF